MQAIRAILDSLDLDTEPDFGTAWIDGPIWLRLNVILFKQGMRAFFVHGFAKNERDNIRDDELVALRKLASQLLAFDDGAIARVIASGTLKEVMCDE